MTRYVVVSSVESVALCILPIRDNTSIDAAGEEFYK